MWCLVLVQYEVSVTDIAIVDDLQMLNVLLIAKGTMGVLHGPFYQAFTTNEKEEESRMNKDGHID